MSDAVNDFLMGGAGASAKFDYPGDTVAGTITAMRTEQQTDYKTGQPKFWDNGNKVEQLVIGLQTDLREDGDDDGIRNLYIKGSAKIGSQSSHDAVRAAVQASGAKTLDVGGWLALSFIGEESPSQRGLSPRKLWQAQYRAPDPAAGFLNANPGVSGGGVPAPVVPAVVVPQIPAQPMPTQPVPVPVPQMAAQPMMPAAPSPQAIPVMPAQPAAQAAPVMPVIPVTAASAPAAFDPMAQVREMIRLGYDDNAIASATGVVAAVVAQVRDTPPY